jgi:quercetin dioxygenase-like cupin family protein
MDTAKALLMTDDPGPNERAADDVVLNVDDGETITEREGRLVVLLAERPEIAITWYRAGPGERGPDPHVHREHTDAFHVLEGELTFALGPDPELIRMPAGSFVAAPPNVVHTFANESSADACWLNLHAPDTGFAAYLRGVRDGARVPFDQFAPPADGGLPAGDAIVAGPDEGERLVSGGRVALLKAVRPELCVAEWVGERDVPGARHTFAYTRAGEARTLSFHAPDGGFADALRRAPD